MSTGADTSRHSSARPMGAVDQVVDFCWYCFKWTLLFGVIAAAVWMPHLWQALDEQIRAEACAMLAEQYPGLRPSVRSAQLIEGEAIVLNDVTLAIPNGEQSDEIFACEKIVLACPTKIAELIKQRPEIVQITFQRPTLRLARGADGRWNAAKLLPLPQFQRRPVPFVIEDGRIEVVDRSGRQPAQWCARNFDAVVDPIEQQAAAPENAPAAEFLADRQRVASAPTSPEAGAEPLPTTLRRIQATFSGDHVGGVRIEGVFDARTLACELAGRAEQIVLGPELLASLPQGLCDEHSPAAGLRGRTDIDFVVGYDPKVDPSLRYQLQGRLSEGRYEDSRLPHPLSELRTFFRIDNSGVVLDELTARSNQAYLRLNYRQSGWAASAVKEAEAEIRQLELDRRLLAVLPPDWQEHWYKYRPSGVIDARAKLRFDGVRWIPDLSVECVNVSFSHYRFPYRLDDGRGTITLRDGVMQFNLTACTGHENARLHGEIRRPGPEAVGWMEVRAENVPIDAKLLAAVPRETQPVLQSLGARGSLGVYVRLWRDEPDGLLHRHVSLSAQRCSVLFEKFPYPIRNISGELEMFDDQWTFRNLQGMNDTGRITCRGVFAPSIHGKELKLEFIGRDIPLDQELRDALRPAEKQVWMAFRPRGAVDLTAEVRYLTETKQLSVTVRAEPQAETAAIEPVHFPYRLERLRGLLEYRDGHVVLHNIKAEHGLVRLTTGGWLHFDPDGRWRCRLEDLSVDRLRIDRDLIPALPERLKRALVELRPTGPINIRGMFELSNTLDPNHSLESQWDVTLGLQQCAFECGPRVENINGTMKLIGRFDGGTVASVGALSLDSLSYRDLQLTELQGPIFFDESQVLLGVWVAKFLSTAEGEVLRSRLMAVRHREGGPEAPDSRGASPEQRPVDAADWLQRSGQLRSRVFGGELKGDGWIALGAVPRYGFRAELEGGSLAQCAQEMLPGKQDLRGAMYAVVDLRGQGRSTNLMQGRGAVQLRDADIYELPLMVALLKILSVRLPNTKAFSSSDIRFRIEGEHVYFDQLDFNGDAVSLLGKGEMDLQQNLRLTFHAILGRGELNMPIVREVFSGAGKQIMLIHVGGTPQSPEMRREALPGLNQALQQLQEDREAQRGEEGGATARVLSNDRSARRNSASSGNAPALR